MERKDLSDRQFEAVLERLDRLCDEVSSLNRRTNVRTASSRRLVVASP